MRLAPVDYRREALSFAGMPEHVREQGLRAIERVRNEARLDSWRRRYSAWTRYGAVQLPNRRRET